MILNFYSVVLIESVFNVANVYKKHCTFYYILLRSFLIARKKRLKHKIYKMYKIVYTYFLGEPSMRVSLLRLTTFGVKNLRKPITIDFCNSTKLKSINNINNNVKAIYGSNGAGKSAIIYSVLLAKNLMMTEYYFTSLSNDFFDSLINKDKKDYYFKVFYAAYDERKKNHIEHIYSYTLEVKRNDQRFYIAKEELAEIKENNLQGKAEIIYSSENGELKVEKQCDEKLKDLMIGLNNHQLETSSLISRLYLFIFQAEKLYLERKENLGEQKIIDDLLSVNYFAKCLNVWIEDSDKYENLLPTDEGTINYYKNLSAEEVKRTVISNLLVQNTKFEDKVDKSMYSEYQKYIAKLADFIKLFKPDLQRIELIKKEDEHYYYFRKTLVYEKWSISEELESSGIKKLMSLYSYIGNANLGGMVFIDEMDANISGVYLRKLIQYFEKYGKGQLIFTCHSMDPMYVLYRKKRSIYFIGEDNSFAPWIRNGNYRPFNLYPEGMIEGSPFNIEDFDFLNIFGEDK
jgi:hypothetical protein